jgi:hypothetical protein
LQAIEDRAPDEVEKIVRLHKKNAFEELKQLMAARS